MTTSLERTLAAHLAECLELDAACRRVFQAAAALRTDNKRSVLAVKRTARNLKLLMDDKLHSLDIENVIDGFGDEAETCTAGSALVLLANVMNFPLFLVSIACAAIAKSMIGCHFASFFIVIAIVLPRRLLHCIRRVIAYAGVCVTKPSLLESRNDIW